MRYSEINELAGVKRFKDMTATKMTQYIKDNMGDGPVKILGSGANGVAIMIGANVYKMWMIDSAYQDYVLYCLKNQDNQYIPKFYSDIKTMPAFFIRHPSAPDLVNYIKMEHLVDGKDILSRKTFAFNNVESDNKCSSVSVRNVVDIFFDIDSMEGDACDNFLIELNNFLNEHSRTRVSVTMHDLPDDLILFINTLSDINKLKHSFDLHSGNFMVRANTGQLVILDPIVDHDDMMLNDKFETFDSKFPYDKTVDHKKARLPLIKASNEI